mmetsp:Transcript_37404/g.36989  ORF Transcript_37404/g.36989 Transcript_37404/m.36989 type:complete len:225 (-) Transcript_37404:59-733(-)
MIVEESQRITPKKALHHPWFKKFLFKKKKMLGADSSHIEKIENFKDSNHLKKAILTFLSAKASDEDIKEEIELFNNYDTNNDGYITKKELKKGMTKLHNFTNDDIEKFMESMDTDKNGAINFNEFISATLNNKISTDYSRIVKAFEFFDLDNDGQIDKKELQEALTGKSFEMIDMQIFEGVIDECDKDRDGKINFEEFSQTVSNKLDIKTKQKLSEYGKPAETP